MVHSLPGNHAMNWEIAAALGEILGACAVIITIGFLAIQLRQSNTLGKAEAERDWFAIQQQIVKDMTATEESAKLMQAGFARYSELTSTQQAAFSCRLINFFDHVDALRRLHEKGYVADDLLDRLVANLNGMVCTPGGKEWWKQTSSILAIAPYFEKHRQEDAVPITDLLPFFAETESPAARSS